MNEKINSASSIDTEDVDSFDRIAGQWWDEQGAFKPLHQINPHRMRYIRESACQHFQRDKDVLQSLKGLRVLDIGCGGGLVCEPLARMGADVSGLDAGTQNIEAAKAHAQQQGLDISYHAMAAEDLINQPNQEKTYDIVCALEILEHVNDPAEFVALVQKFVKPNGLVIYSTLNRTLKSLAFGKIAAEYILSIVPRGTHDWKKFIKPSELARMVRKNGGQNIQTKGLIYNPIHQDFHLDQTKLDINYFLCATVV